MCRLGLGLRFLLMTALVDLLIGDSLLLLYFSESRTGSQKSTIVPIFQNLSFFMSVFYCVSVAMIVSVKQDYNCF